MFAKTSLVTAILAAFTSTAFSAQIDTSITQDLTLTEHTDLSIAGDSPIVAGTDSNQVSIDLNGYDLTLSKTTTTSGNKGIFYNTVFSGKGNEHLTVNAQLIGGGIGKTTIKDMDTFHLIVKGQHSKGFSGYGTNLISNVKHVLINAEEDGLHYGEEANGTMTIEKFDSLSIIGRDGHGIQNVTQENGAVTIKGNKDSTVHIESQTKNTINAKTAMLISKQAKVDISAGTIKTISHSGPSVSLLANGQLAVQASNVDFESKGGLGLNLSGNSQGTITADETTITGKTSGVQALGNSNLSINSTKALTILGDKKGLASGNQFSPSQANIELISDNITITGKNFAIDADNFAGQMTIGSDKADKRSTVALNGNVKVNGGKTTFDHADIRLSEGSYFNVTNLHGEGSTLILNGFVDNGQTVSIVDNNASDFSIMAGGKLNDQYANPNDLLADLKDNVDIKNQISGETIGFGAEAGSVADGWIVDQNGALKPTGNPSMAAVANFNAMNLAQWRGEINHLTQRLGDIRVNGSTVGAWARIYGYDNEVNDTVNIAMKTRSVQAGGDYRLTPNWIVGGAFSYTDADADFSNGFGKSDAYTLAAYATGYFDCGGFIDVIGRVGRLNSEVSADTLSTMGGVLTGDYNNTALGLSVETGYHWKLNNTFYVEPQAELAYGIVMGDDFTSRTNGVKIEQDNFETLVGRLGARFGATFNEDRGQIYAHCSVNHDFKGEAEATATPAWGVAQKIGTDLGGTWTSYGLGAQFDLQNQMSFYGSLERSTGSEYDEDFRYSVGMRYNF